MQKRVLLFFPSKQPPNRNTNCTFSETSKQLDDEITLGVKKRVKKRARKNPEKQNVTFIEPMREPLPSMEARPAQ